ncbi:uncharacterized protein LOC116927770 [Daphnia magna]|uniref:uncharacterized protein LOC116927770 n=1 Tax=Daphnia magna TaxID=35525 RepID=UPI001E1BC6BF|nr:uncharacterized protein LOC116927770 [Daphnia magna]
MTGRGRPPSVALLTNNQRGTTVHDMSTGKKSVSSSSSKKKSTCDTEQQKGNNETESELQSESSTSASLPLPVGVVPLRSTNTQTLDASRHSRESSSSSLTSASSSHSVQQDVHITPPVTEGHVKRLAYALSFFTYHGPSKKEGNSLYTCTVKGCKRDKPFSTVDNSRGNLRAHVRVTFSRVIRRS